MKDVILDYWKYLENKNTKTAKRVLDYLDRDLISAIMVDGKVFWVESMLMRKSIPNYVLDDIQRYMRANGLHYLFENTNNLPF